MKEISDIIQHKSFAPDTRNKHEFQAYGNRLAEELGDTKHRSLFIKLAKTEDRALLEQAREKVLASENATTKGRLFMWYLKKLKKEKKQKNPPTKDIEKES